MPIELVYSLLKRAFNQSQTIHMTDVTFHELGTLAEFGFANCSREALKHHLATCDRLSRLSSRVGTINDYCRATLEVTVRSCCEFKNTVVEHGFESRDFIERLNAGWYNYFMGYRLAYSHYWYVPDTDTELERFIRSF